MAQDVGQAEMSASAAGDYMSNSLGRLLNRRSLLLMAFAAISTLTLQEWVGSATIYSREFENRRTEAHGFVLNNQLPPEGTWSSRGMNGTNIRIGVVYLAAGLHRASGLRLATLYKAIDSVAMVLSTLLLSALLAR